MEDQEKYNRNCSPGFGKSENVNRMAEDHVSKEEVSHVLPVEEGEIEYEELDPRVQEELEKLNLCTDKINEFELQLEEANAVFRTLLTGKQYLSTLMKFSKN